MSQLKIHVNVNFLTLQQMPPSDCERLRVRFEQEIRLLFEPADLASTPNGNIVVCGSARQQSMVYVYQPGGCQLTQIHMQHGSKPWGVACSKDSIYITDIHYGNINVYTMQGTLKEKIPLKFKGKSRIATTDKRLFVTSSRDSSVYYYKLRGNLRKGVFAQDMHKPSYIAASPDGRMIAVASRQNGVSLFESDGSLMSWGEGSYTAEFQSAYGVAIDEADRLFVSDHNKHSISILSPQGDVAHIDLTQEGLSYPESLLLLEGGRLLVTCRGETYRGYSNKIATYTYTFLNKSGEK